MTTEPKDFPKEAYPDKLGIVYFNDGTSETGPYGVPPSENYVKETFHTALLTARDKEIERLREAAQELLDEIDSSFELGGPSFDGSELLREALKADEEKG